MTAEKISKAKTNLVLDMRSTFFSMIALKLNFVEDDACPTMWTDGLKIGYNSEFVKSLTIEELVTVICHEIYHIILLHPFRKKDRDHVLFNIAGDYAINLLLDNANFRLPKGALLDYRYNDKSTEEIYEELKKNSKQIQIQISISDKGMIGEVRTPKHEDGTPLSEGEIKQLEADIKVAVKQAAEVMKKRGLLPAELERLIKQIIKPTVNWKDVLQQFVTSKVKNDYTWIRPNKRYLPDCYLPSLENPEIENIVVAIDTSGSLNNNEFGEIATELKSILLTYKTNITLIHCDAKVQKVEEMDANTELTKVYGGGGTSYTPVFKEIEKLGLNPTALIYFTDGWCDDFPKTIPEYPVLWVLTKENNYFKNPFGNVVVMRTSQ